MNLTILNLMEVQCDVGVQYLNDFLQACESDPPPGTRHCGGDHVLSRCVQVAAHQHCY